jgi:transcriptional pleiotropic regulator of transition state genes
MEIREVFDIKTKDHLEIYVQGDTIVLKKHAAACTFCNTAEDLVDFEGKKICKRCLRRLSDLA